MVMTVTMMKSILDSRGSAAGRHRQPRRPPQPRLHLPLRPLPPLASASQRRTVPVLMSLGAMANADGIDPLHQQSRRTPPQRTDLAR